MPPARRGGTLTGKPIVIGGLRRSRERAGLEGRHPGQWRPAGEYCRAVPAAVWRTGRFITTAHILDHEDEGMMRAFVVMPMEAMKFEHGPHGGHQH